MLYGNTSVAPERSMLTAASWNVLVWNKLDTLKLIPSSHESIFLKSGTLIPQINRLREHKSAESAVIC